tara:strand:- start:442 stop:1110 length:669 start_codon:yes stop_codon:yes gene_type:complete
MAASTSTASKDREERQKNTNQNIANQIKNKVKEDLGLMTTVPGPMPYLQDEKKTKAYNLKGDDQTMYGDEASHFTKKAMDAAGLGTYNEATGSFTNIVGNKIIGNASSIMYGNSGGAMGSGDPSGVMSSIPLSKEMLKSQNKFLGLATAGISLAMPGIGGSIMRVSAGKNLIDAAQPQEAYNDYMKKFDAKQKGKKFTSDRNIIGLLGLKQDKKTKKDTLGN